MVQIHPRACSKMLKVYNTLTRRIEEFKPIKDKSFIGIYNCGPTLHKFHTQIGNLRSYVFADFVKRYFLYKGYKVKHVIKITDIDDHILEESQKVGLNLGDYTKEYFEDYVSQINKMNILEPVLLPRVTDHISEIIDSIKKLSKKKLTYISNGSVYFRVNGISDYGKLVNLDKRKSLMKNAQMRVKDFVWADKENVNDFCLWKAYRPEDEAVFWDSEFGKGRPGWHIECAVISQKYLGENFDIHIGGISHIFPHHTNEIAIAESISKKKFVNYWLHHDYLVVNEEKMSKEKGTFYTLKDIILKGYNPLVLRYVLIKTHYRQKLNFTFGAMDLAKELLLKIITFLNSLDFVKAEKDNDFDIDALIVETEKSFIDSLENDFNISEAMKSLIEFIKSINRNFNQLNLDQANKIKDFVFKIDAILGCIKPLYADYKAEMKIISEKNKLNALFEKRIFAKKEKNWELSDKLKKQIENCGLVVKDQDNSNQFHYELRNFKELS